MRVSSAFPSNYLKAADLQNREVPVTISRVVMEDIGQSDHKPVLYFEGKDKGIVLNKTNATNIALAYGDETDLWAGKQIVLFTAWVDFQGRSVEAIRVRPGNVQPTPTQPMPDGRPAPVINDDADVPF